MHLLKLLLKSEVLVSSFTSITSSSNCVVPCRRLQGALLLVNREITASAQFSIQTLLMDITLLADLSTKL